MNSATDFPHHAFHTLFYYLYGIYRALFFKKNPLLTTYSPEIIDETENYFKFMAPENKMEITVYPFCVKMYDMECSNKWQVFVSPISKDKSRYLINIESSSGNSLNRSWTYFIFHMVIRYLAMPEDQKWLKTSYESQREGKSFNLCDNDFGLRNYLRKFFNRRLSRTFD